MSNNMAVSALSLLITFTAVYHVSVEAGSTFDQILDEKCTGNQVLTGLSSKHSDYYEDREWHVTCSDSKHGQVTDCAYPNSYVNDYDEDFDFTCPSNKVMTGIYGIHKNYYEDRRFKFLCCTVKDLIPHDCKMTSYLNDYDDPLDYKIAKEGQVITGIASVHKDFQEDRKFRVRYCGLAKAGTVIVDG